MTTVGALTRRVTEICERLESIGCASSESHGNGGSLDTVSGQSLGGNRTEIIYREVIIQEVKELEEQRRRREFIILRGCAASDVTSLKRMFKQICEVLGLREVQLSDVVGLRTRGMFRVCVADETRKLLLRSAKCLRNVEEFRSVYVQRDLTLRQRQELMVRGEIFRNSRAEEVGTGNGIGAGRLIDHRGRAAGHRGRAAGNRGRAAGGRGRLTGGRGGEVGGLDIVTGDCSGPASGRGVAGGHDSVVGTVVVLVLLVVVLVLLVVVVVLLVDVVELLVAVVELLVTVVELLVVVGELLVVAV